MRSYNYLLFSYHLICIGVGFSEPFYNGKDRSTCVYLPAFSDIGQDGGGTVFSCIKNQKGSKLSQTLSTTS